MAWIESHQALERHPKVLRLSKVMNWSIDETVGKLHRFWWWCLDYATDGRLEQFDHSTIASVFRVETATSEFVQHLIDLRLLDSAPEIRVHDWWDYAGRFLQVRYKRTPKIWKEIKRFYGHSIQRTNNRTTTEQQQENNHKPNQPNLTNLNQPTLNQPSSISASAAPRGKRKEVEPALSAAIWEAYRMAYAERYGVDPVRNAQVNSMLGKVIDKLGKDDAPLVASFYLTHNAQWYVQKMHPVNLLLADAEKLRTEWATNRKVTNSMAQQQDKQSTKGQMWREIAEELKQKGSTIDVKPD